MGVDQRKRQKKLERRKAKEKAQRRELARRESQGMAARLEAASAAPILHCRVRADMWYHGIGEVLISRQLHSGNVAFVVFLVDLYCLGVKNVILDVAARSRYQAKLYDEMASRMSLVPIKPECARKLVEGAVQYARDLGFSPHADYEKARHIFGEISAETCTEQYQYGKEGKPFFVAGPHDGPTRCKHIVNTLRDRCGPGGFDYLVGGDNLLTLVDIIEPDEGPAALDQD